MASVEPLIGSVDLWPLDWAPQGWAICNGQLLSVNGNQALYSLLGVKYGGDGVNTFGLPDLRGRVPVGMGKQPQGGSINYQLGAYKGGNETLTLTPVQMPMHSHNAVLNAPSYIATGTVALKVKTGLGSGSNNPANNYLGPSGSASIYYNTTNDKMGASDLSITVAADPSKPGSVQIGQAGGNATVDNRMLFQVLNYIIAVQGTYPQRS
jgi:microcystin-dependent protein